MSDWKYARGCVVIDKDDFLSGKFLHSDINRHGDEIMQQIFGQWIENGYA